MWFSLVYEIVDFKRFLLEGLSVKEMKAIKDAAEEDNVSNLGSFWLLLWFVYEETIQRSVYGLQDYNQEKEANER